MGGHGHGDSASVVLLLHHDVAATPPHFRETVTRKQSQTPLPDQTRNLASCRYLHLRHVYLSMKPLRDFLATRRLEKQLQGFLQILPGQNHGLALTRYV